MGEKIVLDSLKHFDDSISMKNEPLQSFAHNQTDLTLPDACVQWAGAVVHLLTPVTSKLLAVFTVDDRIVDKITAWCARATITAAQPLSTERF